MTHLPTRPSTGAETRTWAMQQFGHCDLGDARRTQRLVDYAARQAAMPEASTHAVCGGDDAVAEGVYRWLRNDRVSPEAIIDGPTRATVHACEGRDLILAIQDTSTLVFSHAVAQELGRVGAVAGTSVRGILVHSTLMVDATTREPLGLVDLHQWTRQDDATRPSHKKRAGPDKESVKWQHATERMRTRYGGQRNVITVCDREADVYDYLAYLVDTNERFVIRAAQDRSLHARDKRLVDVMAAQPVIGTRRVAVAQRGVQRGSAKQQKRPSRPARMATMSVRTARLAVARPANQHQGPPSVPVQVLYLREQRPPRGADRAAWMLITTESLADDTDIDRVVGYYECRWLIEEFHKAWKTGCRVETRRLQSLGNLQRFIAVTAPIAVRILALRTLAHANPSGPCTHHFSDDHWRCLLAKTAPERQLPEQPPSMQTAVLALAKLGGWRDTKRTGRIGWHPLWRGWTHLEALVEGWRLARDTS